MAARGGTADGMDHRVLALERLALGYRERRSVRLGQLLGLGFELDVISACVLGGVSLQGGRARIFGVVIGVLIMGTVENVMNLLNVDAFYQYLVRGLILLAAVLLDQLKTRGERRA